MNASFWKTPEGDWAICDGARPIGVKGYVRQTPEGWHISNDQSGAVFLDIESAASRILDIAINGTSEYTVSKDGEVRVVRTYPEVLERLKREGWTISTHLY
jgi:hypothetical protein